MKTKFFSALKSSSVRNNHLNFSLVIIAITNIIMFISLRYVWYFNMAGRTFNLIYLLVAEAVSLIVLLFARKLKTNNIVYYTIGVFFTLLSTVFSLFCFFLNIGNVYHFFINIRGLLPFIISIYGAILFIVLSNFTTKKSIIAILLIVFVVTSSCFFVINPSPIRFVTGAVVFDSGDSYTIEFITNVKSHAWIELTSENGQTETLYDLQYGKNSAYERVHKIEIEKAKLEGATYTVYSKRSLVYTPNTVYYGRTISLAPITFKKPKENGASFLSISDIHSVTSAAIRAASHIEELDFLVFNGDIVSFLSSEKEIEELIIKPAAVITKGQIPFYYVRGNHELMGGMATKLIDYIETPTDKFYYTFSYGNVYGIALDLAEDKDTDSANSNYSPYRYEQVDWLKSIVDSEDYKKYAHAINLVHVPLTSEGVFKQVCQEMIGILNKFSLIASISGHTHKAKIHAPDEFRKFYVVEDGGHTDKAARKIVATYVEIHDSQTTITFFKDSGEILEKNVIV